MKSANERSLLKANIWKYYLFNFLNEFTLFLPFIIYYFQQKGFSLGQIAVLQSITAITVFIFEIPSGYIADRIGRKNSILISMAFQLAGVIILYSASSYPLLAVAYLLNGLSWAFVSGADSALLYDTLLFLRKEKEYKKIEGKAKFFGEIAIVASAVIGSLIVVFGIRQTILYTMIGYALALFLAMSLKEPPREESGKRELQRLGAADLLSIIRKSLRNKKLLGLFSYSFIVLGVSSLIFITYQPYFKATGLPLRYYGYVFAAFSIMAAATSLKAHIIEERVGVRWSLVLMPLLLAASLIGGSIIFAQLGFMIFFLRELVRGYVFPVIGDYTNKLTSSRERATVLSIGSMFSRAGFVIISIIFGFLSDSQGLRNTLLCSGFIMIFFTIIVLLLIRKNDRQAKYEPQA